MAMIATCRSLGIFPSRADCFLSAKLQRSRAVDNRAVSFSFYDARRYSALMLGFPACCADRKELTPSEIPPGTRHTSAAAPRPDVRSSVGLLERRTRSGAPAHDRDN